MGITERLTVQVDDADLDAALTKIAGAKINGDTISEDTRRLNELNKRILEVQQNAVKSGIVTLDKLPAINRDMRMLVTATGDPRVNEALGWYFQGRRGVRAGEYWARSAALTAEGLAPELAQKLALQSMIGYAALILYVTKIIYGVVKRVKDGIEQERLQYEDFIRKELDLTHREYLELSKEQSGFASRWDQFQYTVSEEGIQETVMQVFYTTIRETFIRDMEVQFGPIRTQWVKWFMDAQQWYYSGVDP